MVFGVKIMRLKAILPEVSAFVSASAGTGKTKTLIDRLLNLLLSQVKPNKILCLAFTKAAAAEILARINQKLADFSICERETLHKELNSLGFNNITAELEYKARALFTELIDAADPLNIQTIHAFCQQLLTKFPFEAGINLNFKLLTENKAIFLIDEAKNILLNSVEKYPNLNKSLSYLSWHIKEYSLNMLMLEIIANREKLDCFFNIHGNLNEAINAIDIEAENEDEAIANFIKAIPLNLSHLSIMRTGGINDQARANKLEKFLEASNELQMMLWSDYVYCFLTQTDSLIKSLAAKKIYNEHPEFCNLLENEQQRVYRFNQYFKQIKVIHLTKAFITLSYYIHQVYLQLKQQNNVLDYDDLISLSSELLENGEYSDWIRYKLDGEIDHLLIDEAQDNSSIQWNIINKISEEF